jgi:hypothetical protein
MENYVTVLAVQIAQRESQTDRSEFSQVMDDLEEK